MSRMDFSELQVFMTVATEHGFSRAAARLNRTQPAVSQAVKRLEEELNERLFDRSSKGGQLTEGGTAPLGLRAASDPVEGRGGGSRSGAARSATRRVLIGANEAAVHVLLPVIERFREDHPQAQVEVSRQPARQIAGEVLNRTLDFGVLTFQPRERGLLSISLGEDELVMLIHPAHPSPSGGSSRWRSWVGKRLSPTTTHRRRGSESCGCTSNGMRRSTSRSATKPRRDQARCRNGVGCGAAPTAVRAI